MYFGKIVGTIKIIFTIILRLYLEYISGKTIGEGRSKDSSTVKGGCYYPIAVTIPELRRSPRRTGRSLIIF